MSESKSTSSQCKHCGGALIDKLDDIACVMCGRVQGHLCENCQFKDEPKEAKAPKARPSSRKPARKNKRGKKAEVA